MDSFRQLMKTIPFLALSLAVASSLLVTGCASNKTGSCCDSAGTNSCCDVPDAKVSEGSHFTVSHTARLGTNRIHYVTVGKGDHTLVLVHCWSGNLTLWREQIPALRDKARLVLIDLPGHGQSDKPHVEYSMDYFAEAVLAVMNDAHVDKATLIGHSMGAPIICRVYAQAPQRVAALVSVDGTLRRPPSMTLQQREEFIAPFRKPDYREHIMTSFSGMFATNAAAVRDEVLGELMQTPQYVMVGAMEGMFGADQPDWKPKSVNVPVLSIHATNPRWDDDYKEFVRSLSPKTEYRSIDGAGHWLMLEKPAEFNAALVEVLRKYDLIAK